MEASSMAASRRFTFIYFFVASLDASCMVQFGTDQHEGGAAIRETAHHTGTAADLPAWPPLPDDHPHCSGLECFVISWRR